MKEFVSNKPEDELRKWHHCHGSDCHKEFNFWDYRSIPLKTIKKELKDWVYDTEDDITEFCPECYIKESAKGSKCKKCGNTNIFQLRDNGGCLLCIEKELEKLAKEWNKDEKGKYRIWVHFAGGGDDKYYIADTEEDAKALYAKLSKSKKFSRVEEPILVK